MPRKFGQRQFQGALGCTSSDDQTTSAMDVLLAGVFVCGRQSRTRAASGGRATTDAAGKGKNVRDSEAEREGRATQERLTGPIDGRFLTPEGTARILRPLLLEAPS